MSKKFQTIISGKSSALKGQIYVPSDKSISHRALILGSLAIGKTIIIDLLESEDVFKTANEIDQNWIIEHASRRQEYICQSQSVNLFFVAPRIQASQEEHDNYLRYTNKVHYQAWKKGLKSLYYLRSREGKSAENINLKVKRVRLEQEATEEECLSCEA